MGGSCLGMKRQGWKKLLIVLMAVFTLIPTLSLNQVFAEDEVAPSPGGSEGTGNNASDMSRSMINFFREERTNIQVDRVSVDEYKVYGVFLSNFFVPWSTKLSDMIDDTGANSIPKKMSKKFFGSEAKKRSNPRT